MDTIEALKQLGVYAVTIVILISGIVKLWTFVNNLIERLFKIVENNTQAMKDNAKATDNNTTTTQNLVNRFDDFISNNKRR